MNITSKNNNETKSSHFHKESTLIVGVFTQEEPIIHIM